MTYSRLIEETVPVKQPGLSVMLKGKIVIYVTSTIPKSLVGQQTSILCANKLRSESIKLALSYSQSHFIVV